MPEWSVRVDADAGDLDEALSVALAERLASYSAAVGAAHTAGRPVSGRITVQFAVQASTLNAAQDEARREITAALREQGWRARLVRMEAMPWEEFEAELSQAPPEIMGAPEIAAFLDVARQRVYQLAERDDFPAPIAHLAGGSIWYGAAVRRWAKTWERKRGRPRKSAAG